MKITSEREIKCWELDVDLSEEEVKEISSLGLDLIKDDNNALISYVINRLLKQMVEKENQDELPGEMWCGSRGG